MANQASIPSLAQRRKEWLDALSGSDQNSIVSQLEHMTWDIASFSVVNEAVRLAPKAPEGGVQLNGLMHELIVRCFFVTLKVSVRRLVDGGSLDGEKGVFSLKSLLNDLERYRTQLTRKAIFEAEGREYDYRRIMVEEARYEEEQVRAGNRSFFIPPELDPLRLINRHEQIDFLAGVAGVAERRPDDVIREEVLKNLKVKMESACRYIKLHVDKFVAHAATPASRDEERADEIEVTLGNLREAHRSLCQVEGFLEIVVLGGPGRSLLDVPLHDPFIYMDRPLIAQSDLPKLSDMWRRLRDEYETWSQWGPREYRQEFEG